MAYSEAAIRVAPRAANKQLAAKPGATQASAPALLTLRGGFEAGPAPPRRARAPLLRLRLRLGQRRKATSVAAKESEAAPARTAEASGPAPLKDTVAGALARAASQSTIHPLDTVKVQMQAGTFTGAGLSKYGRLVPPNAGNLQRQVQGLANLYRGVGGAASGAGIAIGAYFALYSSATQLLQRRFKDMPPGAVAFAAGAAAAAGGSFVKVPLAVCIRSVQAGVYPNVLRAGKQIVSRAGAKGLFTGFVPTFLEDIPDMAVKFAAYESLRRMHARMTRGRQSTPQEDFAMGALSGSVAAAASTPLDVIKTRMMCSAASSPSALGAARAVLSEGRGVAGFFAGVGPRALSNGVNTAVFFAFFEAIKKGIDRFEAMDARRKVERAHAKQQQAAHQAAVAASAMAAAEAHALVQEAAAVGEHADVYAVSPASIGATSVEAAKSARKR